MKVVLDTNCLLVALPKKSPYHCIWEAFRYGRIRLCFSTEILHEYEEVLLRNYSVSTVSYIMEVLVKSTNAVPSVPYYRWQLISADPDDNKFVDCALNAGAELIVSNDKHFNVLKEIDFPAIQVVDMANFKNLILSKS